MADEPELAVVEPERFNMLPSDIPTCSVCYEMYHSTERPPRMFPCGHTFCLQCIVNICANTQIVHLHKKVACATCRQSVVLKNLERPQDSFPPNYILRELIEKCEDTEQSQKYQCKHCQNEFHEKDLTLCDTCFPTELFASSERDFMQRPNDKLMCEDCTIIHHRGHTFMPFKTVSGRWKYRTLFDRCLNVAAGERIRMNELIKSLEEGLLATKNYLTNFDETVCQIAENAGQKNIQVILRNFVKAANGSSVLFESVRDNVTRLSKPSEAHFRMLGENLFRKGSGQEAPELHNYLTNEYKEVLKNLFTENNAQNDGEGSSGGSDVAAGSLLPRNNPEEPGIQQDLPQPQIAQPVNAHVPLQAVPGIFPPAVLQQQRNLLPVAANRNHNHLHDYNMILQVQPALFEQFVNNVAPVELPAIFQPVAQPPVQPLNADHLNVVLHYFQNIQAQQRNQYLQAMNFNLQLGIDQLENARRRAVNVAFVAAQAGVPPLPDHNRIQNYFAIPFHLFNAHLPFLYHETLGNVVRNFANSVEVDNGRDEVITYFFTPPYERHAFTERGFFSIRAVLQSMLLVLIPGQFPYTRFEAMKRDLESRVDFAANGRRDPLVAPDIIVIDDNDDNNNNNNNVVREEDAGVEIVENEDAAAEEPPIEQELHRQDSPGQEVQLVHQREADRDQQRDASEEPNDEPLREMQRQGRQNFVFQMDDLVVEPPARATRAAKRRIDNYFDEPLEVLPSVNAPILGSASASSSEPRRRGRPLKRKSNTS